MQSKKAEIKQYISTNVNIFVEPLVYQIVKHRPADPAVFAINWLKQWVQDNRKNTQHSDSEPEEEEQQTIAELQSKIQRKKLQGKSRSRIAISEQVFGNFNKRASVQLRSFPKSSEDQVLIQSLIKNSILFQNVDHKDQELLIKAMEEVYYQSGDAVITEGEDGDHLFVVQSGQYDCFKLIEGEHKYLKTYRQGQLFGELALLYNAPRAASISCKSSGKLYKLDRITFSQVVKAAASKKRQLFKRVLDQIEIFSSISSIQKQQFLDVLKEEKYETDEYVIRQGEQGNKFYIVVEGQLVAEKHDVLTDSTKIVYNYKEGDYFGELALLHDISRQASVKALSPVRVVYLDRESFKRVFGSMQEILKRNEQRYQSSRKNLVCA